MAAPNTPTSLHINHTSSETEVATRNTDGSLDVSAIINDPDGQKVRLVVRYSTDKKFGSQKTALSGFVNGGARATATLTGLALNSHYYVRAYAQSSGMQLSSNYNGGDFYTDRIPNAPGLIAPAENATFAPTSPIPFDWSHSDPDGGDPTGYNLNYRTAGTPTTAAGPWVDKTATGTAVTTVTLPGGTFKPSTVYEWRVRTRDPQNKWGEYSLIQSFTTNGPTKAPVLLGPIADAALYVDADNVFTWQFRDPLAASTQGNADIRWRVAGADDTAWVLLAGSALTDTAWELPAGTFIPGYRYEWQVRTYRSAGVSPLSDWSASGFFWGILTPGASTEVVEPADEVPQAALGIGTHEVYLFEQGGIINRGRIGSVSKVTWGRLRDGISAAEVTVSNFDDRVRQLLRVVDVWAFEIVIYRNGDRVWEGPVTHITDKVGEFTIAAVDVMGYVYRRIMRQGYNDGYRLVAGVQQGLKTVVERAAIITANALAYYDPNVLPYLTLIQTGSDARQSRIVPDYTKTAYNEIDDLAANAGLDYSVVTRRIIYWDTHQPIGRLPEMTSGDFSEQPVVTTYGMSLANYFAVTDGQGNWGAAIPQGSTNDDWMDYYGPIEQLASGYGDADPDVATLTPAIQAQIRELLTQQAKRNVNGRYPAPRVARVPDNATLLPTVNVGINQLVPGVQVPLRVDNCVRPFRQMQKLDSMTVTEENGVENVTVVMAPAPLSSEIDPDAESGEDEESL